MKKMNLYNSFISSLFHATFASEIKNEKYENDYWGKVETKC